jgi:Icc-related predicted phosphoesterase
MTKAYGDILFSWIGTYIKGGKTRMSTLWKIIDVIQYTIIVLYIVIVYYLCGLLTLLILTGSLMASKYYFIDLPNIVPIMYKTPKEKGSLRIVCISDTHNLHDAVNLPPGDILIHCGDFTKFGTQKEVSKFNSWLKHQDFKYKIVIPGNHDYAVCPNKNPDKYKAARMKLSSATHVLYEESVEIEGYKFFGTSYLPPFHDMAFNRTEEELETLRSAIPDAIDILISHTPPLGMRDLLWAGRHVGDATLMNAINRIKPLYSLFGHIHEARGVTVHNSTTFINCAICTLRYNADNEAIVFDLPQKLK